MKVFEKISGWLKDAFKERHHLLNPPPAVVKKLKAKGYSFEFNYMATIRGPLIKLCKITTPEGVQIGSHVREANKEAIEKYKADYAQAFAECTSTPEPR